jgi:hypothetical protein
MLKLRIGIIDLVTKAPTRALYGRVMHANFASIMPQVIATWCEQEGHDVTLVCYTGFEDLANEVPENVDIVFIGAFTQAAQQSYALSNRFRANGAITVLGGPHARCYPQDARKYFDYVLGFTDRQIIHDILQDCSQNRPLGQYLSANQQPVNLPGVRERWKFIEQTLRKAPLIKIVPMIGSMGCPYSCSFCIDSTVAYQPMEFETIREDLRFLLTKYKRPRVGWHDPNFGIRFDDYMGTIEEAVPPDSIDFIAESSLSILTEPHLKRLKHNGFKAILPGIESWYEMGNKSKTGSKQGEEKLRKVSEHVNMILRYLPYVQTNFVLGLDSDDGSAPFELTKRFIDMTPAAFPAYSLLSAFGQAAPLNLEYQLEDRVLPFPFHFLNNNHAMNVKPKNYSWPEFYDHVIDLTAHSFSWRSIINRFRATSSSIPKWMNFVRATSSEGFGRLKFYRKVRSLLEDDRSVRDYFEGESTKLPQFYYDIIKRDLTELWDWLPEEAMHHDPYAYLKDHQEREGKAVNFVSNQAQA